MKKILSILLSFLMVFGTVTCMFTMPTSAEEAATEVVTESLPSNLFTKTTTTTIRYDTANQYVHYYVKWSNPEQSNLSYIMMNQYHQLNFEVTASEDLGDGVIAYPVVMSGTSAKSDYAMNESVGIRYDVTEDYNVETVWNYVAKQTVVSGYEESINEETSEVTKTEISRTATTYNDATPTLEAGKTYRYTFIFKASVNCLNGIAIRIKGLSDLEAGSVTVSNPYVFNLHNTDWYNFVWAGANHVRYMVEEDGNVYQRIYGYRDAGEAMDATKRVTSALNARVGGDYYDFYFEAGNTYKLNYKLRLVTPTSIAVPKTMPSQNIYETRTLNYDDAYANILNASDTEKLWSQTAEEGKQVDYIDGKNPYAFDWNNTSSNSYIRRKNGTKFVHFAYTNPETGTSIWSEDNNTTSGIARDIMNNSKVKAATGSWMDAVFSVSAFGQTIEECATKANKSYMRYSYDSSAKTWGSCNSTYKNYYVPASDNAYVAFAMAYLYKGVVYDFDAFEVTSDLINVVEYKNPAGEVIELPENEAPAIVRKNALTGEMALINYDTDAFTFEGWYVNGELVSTDDVINVADTSSVKAVIVYNNISGNGSFEQYTTPGVLNQYVSTTGGTKNYTVKTGEFADNEWALWDSWAKADAAETADFLAQYPYITTIGGLNTSVNNYNVQIAIGTLQTDAAEIGNTSLKTTVSPYRGNAMLMLKAYSRQAVTKVSGLQAGKTYNVSFMTWSPTSHDYIDRAFAANSPKHLDKISTGNDYKVDGVVVNDYLGGVSITPSDDMVGNWKKVTYTFLATDSFAYLAFGAYNISNAISPSYIDDLVVTEYDCKGNHTYDDLADTTCNLCGEAREYVTEWNFDDESLENYTYSAATVKFVDAEGQPNKIGGKYLEYTSTGWGGMAFNFMYEQGYKYTISYDFKIFSYGTGSGNKPNPNGIDHNLNKFDDGKYGNDGTTWGMMDESYGNGAQTEAVRKAAAAALNPATDNLITRYWENGQTYQKVTCFSHAGMGENNYVGRISKDGAYIDAMFSLHGGEIWDEWQHTVIEVGTNNDYEGLVEYGIRPNDAGWVVGIDNFKVERVSTAIIDEADTATVGTKAYNIRAKTTDQKQGLRFKSTIDLDSLNLADGAKIVEYGTLAMKAELLNQGFNLVRQAAKDKALAGRVVAGVAYNEADGTDIRYAIDETNQVLTYTGVLTGISVESYDVDFAVRGYAVVEFADGTRTTVYDEVQTLSVYYAAVNIVETSKNESDKAVAQKVIDTYDTYVNAN